MLETLWETVTTGNLLQAWLLEAALVSTTSYLTHDPMLCNSRLRRCAIPPESGGPRFLCLPQRLLKSVRWKSLPKTKCSTICCATFDGARFGALFGTEVACDWTLLPLGFHPTENVSGLDLAGSTRLQLILGVDLLVCDVFLYW